MEEDQILELNSKKLITPEVEVDMDVKLYLIKRNSKEICFCSDEQEALLCVDSIAAAEQRFCENEWVRSYREDYNDGQRVIISTQSVGYLIHGGISQTVVVEYLAVNSGLPIKCRWALGDVENATDMMKQSMLI